LKTNPIFPQSQNDYKGHTAIIVITLFFVAVSTIRSLIHILAPDGGASSIAGIALSGELGTAVIFTFAWAGLYQLLFAIIQWLVILRYRKFLPLLLLLMVLEQLGMTVIPLFKGIPPALLSHVPPEAVANKFLLPAIVLLFVGSLIPARTAKGAR
jgi:hypothetical protein